MRSPAEKRAIRRKRRGYAKERAALRAVPPPPPPDGIVRRRSKVTGEMQEFCVTPEAKEKRREEIFVLAKGDCALCSHPLLGSDGEAGLPWHWHHKTFRSHGGDDSIANAQALCYRCHELVHRPQAIQREMA